MQNFGLKIGFGYDVHRLQAGKPFWLGGVAIKHDKGAVGHSDADVLVHAICDALLGAANLRDIGYHFSDQDEAFRGIDSKILLQKVITLIQEKNWKIGNIDTTIALQKPAVSSYIPSMQKVLCQIMNIHPSNLSIKATTTENLGFVGREEGVSAYAVVLLHRD